MGWLALEAFDPAPVAVAVTIGPEHRLVYTDLAFRAFVGDRRLGEPVGRTLGAAAKQDYGELLDRVLAAGDPFSLVQAPVKPADVGASDTERHFSYRQAARRVQGSFATAGGAATAAHLERMT
ncbi:hypothetical protein [Actinomadura nitritigenes]|uniref:hypothetical protein n=1 Tax=Actinomadura nitritigenes TaxID=134602 RepID=UPI003D8D5A1E